MRGITKRFPGIVANDHVDLDLLPGEVPVLYGLYHPDEGEIVIKGQPVRLGSPKAAIEAGIGMVHQHFMLIPVMTVAENIVLANEPTQGKVLLDHDAARQRVRYLSDTFKF